MEMAWEILQNIGTGLGFALIGVTCLAALICSAVSISGTWLVVLATIGAHYLTASDFPGWTTIVFFLLLSAGVEGAEAVAGAWGVKSRGGSHRAGLAALGGGFLGLFLGGLIPVPLLGPLIGMLAGSFGAAFLVENNRIKHSEKAAEIARGAVIARLLIILLKLGVTFAMVIILIIGFVLEV